MNARTHGLIVEELDGELLILDTETDQAHCLDADAAAVWRACDRQTDIARATGLDADVVAATIDDLADRHLLVTGVNRRDLLRTISVGVAAVAVGAPVIRSIVVPTAAQAASCKGPSVPCSASAECCSGLCAGNACA
jgi:hypothetical protein